MNRAAVKVAAGGIVLNASALAFVAGWEGERREPYLDVVGVPTVCFGHTANVESRPYSDAQCAELLMKDLTVHSRGALRCITVPLNENEQTALVSLAFNVGVYAFCSSTLVRRLNAGDRQAAAEQFLRWNRAGGQTVRGLTNRRKAERALFLSVPV